MGKEYEMLLLFRREALSAEGEEEQLQNTVNKFQSKVKVDLGKINDIQYLQQLQDEQRRQAKKEKSGASATLTKSAYILEERDKADLFLFVKYVYPSLFDKYISQVKKTTQEIRDKEYLSQLKTARDAIESQGTKEQAAKAAKETTF